MRFTQAGAVAALFGLSQSFLIPPEITSSDADIIKTLPFEDAVIIDTRVMEINCPGCPAIPELQGKMHMKQPPSMLKLNFSLSHEDHDQLLLNGLPLYPIDPRSGVFMEPLTAPLMALTREKTWEQTSTPKLGYALSVHHPVAYSTQDQLDLVSIHLEIVEVGDKFVSGLPGVEIKLLETPSGKLMIGDAQMTQPKSEVSKPTDNGQECTTILCKWRAIIADRLSKLKGCGSKARPDGPHAFAGHTGHKKKPHHGHHGRPGPNRPFRHHHRHGSFARFLKGIVLHVFIPVLIGIMVGITASLVGMVAGHIVVFVWRTMFRRGQRQQYIEVKQQEPSEDEEVKSFLAAQGPPPEYQEAVVEQKTEE
ncbi:uncharacterized protein LY89DRAFT_740920 [Mollisia scopiformis]|uniref:DUF7728 domain-containing protein n=1 Tax=Mollisia scopiformis TaxID=149040 RepID=A0A132BDW1_MOLSC|nr:uncharacterized protein LY89DRAFT_740920 [Mollisia scopiformis]KUJ09857.1 hypothetical protein LY89DRAFT_740920 [Mollisia scopiformis]